MTSFAVQTFTPSVVSALVSDKKGSIGNRFDCAGSQIKNTTVTGLQAGAATVAGAAALKGIQTSPGFANGISKGVDFVMNKLKNATSATKSAPKLNIAPHNPNAATKGFKGVKLPHFTKLQMFTQKMKSTLNKLAEKVLTMSPKGKAGLAVAAVALPIIAYIAGKGLYQAGQIDQKYTDKAVMQKAI